MGVEQVAVSGELEQHAPVKIEGLDDSALSLQDRGGHLDRWQIDKPHRQFADQLLEWQPLLVRGVEGMIQAAALGQIDDRGDDKEAPVGLDRMQADFHRRL